MTSNHISIYLCSFETGKRSPKASQEIHQENTVHYPDYFNQQGIENADKGQ